MPRKSEIIKIGEPERTITVQEVRLDYVLKLFEGLDKPDADESSALDNMSRLMSECAGLTLDSLRTLYPSEILILYQAIERVNADFFGLADKLGLSELAANLKKALAGMLIANCLSRFAGSPTPVTLQ